MATGKRPQKTVELPPGWWLRLQELCRSRWTHEKARVDIYEFTKISKRSFDYARKNNRMTEQLLQRLTENVGFESHQDLLHVLSSEPQPARLATPIPCTLSLTTQKTNPQWADYRDYLVTAARPWALRCRVETGSPYFRFGFKLLTHDGRVFGDGSIQSHDPNVVVHIGRNNWDRPGLGISAHDVFLTSYTCGIEGEPDRVLFRSESKLAVPIELIVDMSYCARLLVRGQPVFQQIVPPTVCRRVAVYAWGDREEFRVDVSGLMIREEHE